VDSHGFCSALECERLCPTCEVPGLVILNDEQLDRREHVREFAPSIGLSQQLERQLCFLTKNEKDMRRQRRPGSRLPRGPEAETDQNGTAPQH
jgi:hypothetical protein